MDFRRSSICQFVVPERSKERSDAGFQAATFDRHNDAEIGPIGDTRYECRAYMFRDEDVDYLSPFRAVAGVASQLPFRGDAMRFFALWPFGAVGTSRHGRRADQMDGFDQGRELIAGQRCSARQSRARDRQAGRRRAGPCPPGHRSADPSAGPRSPFHRVARVRRTGPWRQPSRRGRRLARRRDRRRCLCQGDGIDFFGLDRRQMVPFIFGAGAVVAMCVKQPRSRLEDKRRRHASSH